MIVSTTKENRGKHEGGEILVNSRKLIISAPRTGLLIAAALVFVVASFMPVTVSAYNVQTGDYPWHDAGHVPQPPADDNITWGYTDKNTCDGKSSSYNCGSQMKDSYYTHDQWGYYLKNCTSYVAWRVAVEFGVSSSGLGYATMWNNGASAKGWSVDQSPEIGDIAHFEGNDNNQGASPGHVAFVEEIGTGGNAGKVRIAEYNQNLSGNFRNDRWVTASNYLDINGANPSGFTLQLSAGTPSNQSDDFVLYRLENGSTGTWYAKSGDGTAQTPIWGATHGSPGDVPVAADVTGDGIDDFGIYRIENGSTGTWYFKSGANGQPTPIWGAMHGSSGDVPVTGDFNDDGIDDFGIYRLVSGTTGTWYVKSSANGQPTPIWGATHGSPGDVPVVGDFNNDDIDDFGIYRVTNSTGYWYFKSGGDGQQIPSAWGVTHGGWSGDIPLTGDFGA